MITKCPWALTNPLMEQYHDLEWGVPVHNDIKLFEFLLLEGAQAGLSWLTILKKRESYRIAFDNFDPEKIACYNREKIEILMNEPEIIRNRRKLEAAVQNARSFLDISAKHGNFNIYIWSFTGGAVICNSYKNMKDIPVMSKESERMSKDLSANGFRFTGPTICYSFMQAVGIVNDHLTDCFRYRELVG